MNVKRYLFLGLLVLLAGGSIFMIFSRMSKRMPVPEKETRKIETMDKQFSEKSVTHLYFADPESTVLSAEETILPRPRDPAAFGTHIVNALIKGSRRKLMRTLPERTRLRALYVTPDGTAYVDLTEDVRINHPGGAQSELLTIFSIVNSLVLNIPEVDAAKILVEGREAMTLAGHVDLRFPFKANLLLIR